jgi:cell division control protein 45
LTWLVGGQLHTLILLNMGSILDLPSDEWFGSFGTKMSVHIIDSSRPQNLSSLFGAGENGERIIVWDDGGADNMEEEKKAWEATVVRDFRYHLRVSDLT